MYRNNLLQGLRSKQHTTALHVTRSKQPSSTVPVQKNGGETNAVSNPTASKSCAKILPVNVYHKDNPENIVQMYAVIDDQSNYYNNSN